MAQARDGIRAIFERELGLGALEAQDLEIGVYNSAIEAARAFPFAAAWACPLFNEAYRAKARSVFANLKGSGHVRNPRLAERMARREFLPHDVAAMTPDQMFPEAWSDVLEREVLRNSAAYEVTMQAMTDVYTCGKCKQNRCTFHELQTRRADEGSTTFVRCLNCGNRWKH